MPCKWKLYRPTSLKFRRGEITSGGSLGPSKSGPAYPDFGRTCAHALHIPLKMAPCSTNSDATLCKKREIMGSGHNERLNRPMVGRKYTFLAGELQEFPRIKRRIHENVVIVTKIWVPLFLSKTCFCHVVPGQWMRTHPQFPRSWRFNTV